MRANEFAITHATDADWVLLMEREGREVVVPSPVQKGTYNGIEASVARHCHNGIYDIRVPGGVTCVSGSSFVPEEASAEAEADRPRMR